MRIGFRSGINNNFRSQQQETQRRTLNVQHRTLEELAEGVGNLPTIGKTLITNGAFRRAVLQDYRTGVTVGKRNFSFRYQARCAQIFQNARKDVATVTNRRLMPF